MSATNSTMLALGTPAPDFSLPDVTSGRNVSLRDFATDQALVVVFLCAHCPYVHHVQPALAELARDFQGRGVEFVAISSNDVMQYPDDSPESTAQFAVKSGFTFPVLYDEKQEIAQAYTAACTPDFFVFGPERALVYRGQIDSSRPNRSGGGNDLPRDAADIRQALEAILGGQPVDPKQRPSIGCNIKWKPGNEPAYFR